MSTMSTYGSTDLIATEPKRPGHKLNWNEVRAQVQHPNGSVRTSPRLAAAVSPPQTTSVGQALVKPGRLSSSSGSLPFGHSLNGHSFVPPSRGGSSRGGSSGKSSRSSSRDGRAREGDISRPSSGGSAGWESTNSSGASRPCTPQDLVSPMGSKDLLMPDPIRTTLIIPFMSEEEHTPDGKPDGLWEVTSTSSTTTSSHVANSAAQVAPPARVLHNQRDMERLVETPIKFKWDPYGRDLRRTEPKIDAWSIQPLAKYLEGVRSQIDSNLQNGIIPSADKLDKFVERLIRNIHGQLRSAPKKSPKSKALQGLFAHHFPFWNFKGNKKVRTPLPEELKGALTGLIDALLSDDWYHDQSH
mmetsp:Transcript_54228/g.100225  ORF Transcript_54228/g.100225 Transcript_54228/m.100225 type:complete len:357 (-) Transcript_54228:177-1247(-)